MTDFTICACSALASLSALAHAQECVSTIQDSASNDHFGWSLVCIGDVDGDGAADIAVGAPQASNPSNAAGQLGPGYVRVISGRTGAILRTIAAPAGSASRGMFGYSLAAFADSNGDGRPDATGDVTGDSVPDFLVGAPTYDGTRPEEGAVYVVSGANGATILIRNPATQVSARENFGLQVLRILAARAESAGPAIRRGAKFATPEQHWKPQR